ncbi:CoA transferase [uncultured Sneathiella sp.]|uniref:CaiB/BaiF CoA transferase family protein n=1 Tax=uncultured Sneathiella sp. TaxID=879315 RepID=UPI0030ECC99F|tara:strand:+ start:29169 stop:30362 length:1194 start_codon:yes stop_codon:yes gene_type:complete
MAGILDGIRVVELTTVILGPWATQMLGDMGADVIKVETPAGDTTRHSGPRRNAGMGSLYLATNRNKRSIVLDLTKPSGLEALFRVIGTADVFVHNLRPKVARKLGLEYDKFKADFPDLIYCATYGFRAGGPMEDKPAYDDIIQAASGLADLLTVTSDQPRYVPTIMADKTSSLNLVTAILAGIVNRERGGGGQAIEVPMFEALVDFVMVEHLYGACFEPPVAKMGYERLLNTMRKPYATTDGYLAVLPYTDRNWQDLFDIAGRDDLKNDPRFESLATRVAHSEEIYGLLADIIATRSSADWQKDLDKLNIPVQTVMTKEMLLDSEQLKATGFWRLEEHPTEGTLRMVDPPIRFSKTPSTIRSMPPHLGEQSAEILSEVGYSELEINQFIKDKVTQLP